MKLGSKSDAFLQHGQSWLCSSGLQSDVTFQVGEVLFHLHKFPLISRSGFLENLIQETSNQENKNQNPIVKLHDIPGGSYTFLLIAKFCYGNKIELTPSNIVALRCASEYLRMTESYGDRNLILETENYLGEVFCDWDDTMRALQMCQEIISYAETVNIVSRCIDSLAEKACQDPDMRSRRVGGDWWYDDVASLNLSFYRRLILACELRGMDPEIIGGSLMFYAKKYLPLMSRQSSYQKLTSSMDETTQSFQTEADQRALLEEIVALLPDENGIAPTKLLLKLLQICIILNSSSSCRENIEKRIGSHLYEANFEDLMIPNVGYTVETLYDIDCVKRMIDCFVVEHRYSGDVVKNRLVAKLVDNYLAEVAPDANLEVEKFISIVEVVPDYARELHDGIYRAIDIFIKAHPWLTDSEREQICRLINSKKLSFEATTHAAQNERLPIRFISQILFVEQIRLKSSVASWYYASDKSDTSHHENGNASLSKISSSARSDYQEDESDDIMNMKGRVFELEKQCSTMKREIEKLEKSKANQNNTSFFKKFLKNSLSFISCSGKSSNRLSKQIVEYEKNPIHEVD